MAKYQSGFPATKTKTTGLAKGKACTGYHKNKKKALGKPRTKCMRNGMFDESKKIMLAIYPG